MFVNPTPCTHLIIPISHMTYQDPAFSSSLPTEELRQQAKDVVMKLLRVGSYFGELSLLENMLRSASLHAFTWVQLEVFGQQDWLELGKMHPEEMELCRREIRDTVERRRYVHKRESAKSTKPTKKRG